MRQLDIALIIPESGPKRPAALRMVSRLHEDPRFNVQAMLEAPPPATELPGGFARYLTWEAKAQSRKADGLFAALEQSVPLVAAIGTSVREVDVVVDAAWNAGALELVPFAKAGVWRLSGFLPDAGVAEAAGAAPETVVRLTCHDGDGVHEIARAVFGTKFMASRHSTYVAEKCLPLLLAELARLRVSGARADLGDRQEEALAAPPLAPYLGQMTGELGRRGLEKALGKLGRKPGQWCLLVGEGSPAEFEPARGKTIVPDGNRYWADPFLYRAGGETYIFFEDYEYATGKGHISTGRLEDGRLLDVTAVLKRPYHLSYPFIFEHEGRTLMMPEAHQAGRLEIWQADEFPHSWSLYSSGLEGVPATDSVLFEAEDGWWLFTNIDSGCGGDPSSELHLYRVSGPDLKDAVPHPLNPVVVGSKTARGGGRVFRSEGRLLRAAQNNTHGVYGWGLNIMEITRLDDSGYEERLFRQFS
ncbi:MAG: hypothetical protein AAF405_08565, partial [Pseudomonadota bacterium]